MLLESSQAISAGFIPELDFAVIGACCDEFVFVEADSLCLVNEALLIDDVTLRFPFPDDNLAKGLESETDPCS